MSGPAYKNYERDLAIVNLHIQGLNYREIADDYFITRQRVYQIIKRFKERTSDSNE